MKSKLKKAMLLIAICVVINALLACIFACISSDEQPFTEAFRKLLPMLFGMFGGSSVVSGMLMLVSNMPDDDAIKYGAAFYYGTVLCAGFLLDRLDTINEALVLIVSAVIVGLCCYVFWLKHKDR